MHATHYAQALFEATRGKDDAGEAKAVENFIALLTSHGHTKLLPRITEEFVRIAKRRHTTTNCTVRVARRADLERYKNAIAKDTETLQATSLRQEALVDDTLIGGYEVRAQGMRIDRTHKRALITLFETLKRA